LHWTGAAGTSWSTANNWLENRAPINGDVVAFDTTAAAVQSFTSTNDLSNLGLAGLLVNDTDPTPGNDFSITGNGIYLSGGLVNSMTGAATSLGLSALTLLSPATWTNNAGTLNIASNVNMNGMGLTVTGAGNTTLSGVVSSLGSASGLRGDYYSVPSGTAPALLDPTSSAWLGFTAPTVTAITPQVNFPSVNPNSFAPYATVGIDNVAARWTGWINIPTTETVDFASFSDDGSRIFIDGILVVDNDAFQSATYREGSINLSAGLHTIDIEYFQAGGDALVTTGWDPTGSGNPSNVVSIPTSLLSLSNGLTMNGAGTLTLTNANTYTGPTVVNSGTLQVNGSLDPASAVTVGSEGTLGGTGTVGGTVTVNSGGTVSLGATAAVLSSGDLTLSAGSTFGVTLNGTATDQLNVTGTVALNGATLSASLGATPTSGQTFVLINNDGSDPVVGTFAGLAEGATVTIGGHRFFISYQGGDGNDVVLTADHAPVAGASSLSYSVNENQVLNIAAPGLLAGASDPDGDAIYPVLGTGPAHGTLLLNPDGSFTYTPDANFAGSDGFTYAVSDGDLTSALVTVNITVIAINLLPIATNDSYSTGKNRPLVVAAPGVLANDTDPDGGSLSAVLVRGPSHGTLTLNSDGSFTYTPRPGYSGRDSFTYMASDGSLFSAPVNVTLTITHTPVDDDNDTCLLVLGFSGNSAAYFGGGIYNDGSLTMAGSTLANNSAGYFGGGIFSEGDMVIDSTTLTGNSAAYFGGGICTFGTLALSNSTFTGNTPDNLFGSYDDGGGNVFG
jgi:autotransporter-associated beta strand protein/predicted outer membrane repeat protein